jgi:cytochrome c oxidase cbb3-type subunit 2
MKSMKSLFVGIFILTVLGWGGLVLLPFTQFGQEVPYLDEETGLEYPVVPTGEQIRGQQVYQSQGCVYCHTQQVRDPHQGADQARGWGTRRSVARDYIYQSSAVLGYMRLGPDLANVGSDQRMIKTMKLYQDERFKDQDWKWESASQSAENTIKVRAAFSDEEWAAVKVNYKAWLLQHLYAPRSLREWSLMPSYRSLFKEIPVVGKLSSQAVRSDEVQDGFQAVPDAQAEALVAYLMSLDQSYALPEATQ